MTRHRPPTLAARLAHLPSALGVLAVLAVGLLPAEALAERPLTYQEALTSAVEHNPTLVRAALSIEARDGSVRLAQGIFDPMLNVFGLYREGNETLPFQGQVLNSQSMAWTLQSSLTGGFSSGTSYSLATSLGRDRSSWSSTSVNADVPDTSDVVASRVDVSLTQQILEGARLRYNLRTITIARQNASIAELQLEQTRQQTLANAATAYWTFAYQARLRDIATEGVAVAQEAMRVGMAQVQAGQLAPVEQTRLEAALVQAKTALMDAERDLEAASNALLLVMGESPNQVLLPATDPGQATAVDLEPAAATEVALAQNLQLAVARENVETAELVAMNAKHATLPSLSATGGVSVGGLAEEGVGASLNDLVTQPYSSGQVSGNFSVPLGNRAARGARDTAAADVMARQSELQELERSVAAQVEQQVRVLQSAQRRVELADANLALAEQTLAAEEALVDAGRSIQKDVLEARNAVALSKADAAKARTDFRLAQVELLRLQGQVPQTLP